MPVTIKTANLKYKNSQGQYVGVNTVGETTTAEQIAAIEAKGEEVLESIPADYSALAAEVGGKLDASMIVYSATAPSNPVQGMIWLKPGVVS